MRIPKKLKIGTVTYTVNRSPKLKNRWGETSFLNSTITLSTWFNKQYEGGTFMHEIFETINAQHNLSMSHKDVSLLSELLYTVLTENNLLREDR